MLRKIYANKSSFKTIEFKPGLNLILADRQKESGQKDSRNGLGKTTLIRIIDFCLGADLQKLSLPIRKISEWVFTIDIDLCDEKISASRSIIDPKIIIVEGNHSKLPIKAEKNSNHGFYFYKIDDWKKLLEVCLFRINNYSEKYSPTFRTILNYFIRLRPDAYIDPFIIFKNQPTWSIQANNAFLLGLNWHYAAEAQIIKTSTTNIKTLKLALEEKLTSKGELEADRVKLEIDLDKDQLALREFKVHEQYNEILNNSNDLTSKAHDLANETLMLKRRLQQYNESISTEHIPEFSTVEDIYQQVGLIFPSQVKHTLSNVRDFHNTITKNRKNFLTAEIESIQHIISSNEAQIKKITEERAELLKVLETHGALQEFTALQKKYSQKVERLENIRARIKEINDLGKRSNELKAQEIELESKLLRDYEECRASWEKAISIFANNTQVLYNEPGKLIIDTSKHGYKFSIEIPKSGSQGVSKMKIFCYDLMLVDVFSKESKIDFLIHDSTIFDGVDSRQTALALEYAHSKAISENFQYICSFNSDMLPIQEFKDGFQIKDFIRIRLNDLDAKGSLLGFRFNDADLAPEDVKD